MKNRYLKFLTMALCMVAVVFINLNAYGQEAATATWTLTTDGSVVTDGNVTASSLATGSQLTSVGYSALGVYAATWGAGAGPNSNSYYEYKVTPDEGQMLTVNSIKFEFGKDTDYGPTSYMRVYYYIGTTYDAGLDAELGSYIGYINEVPEESFHIYDIGPTLYVPDGQTLFIRIYGSNFGGGLYNRNFVISGETYCLNTFRTQGAGDWNIPDIWEVYIGNDTWVDAPYPPANPGDCDPLTVHINHEVTGIGDLVVDNLVVDGADLYLTGNLAVTGELHLVNGKVYTQGGFVKAPAGNLIVSNPDMDAVVGGGPDSYVVGNLTRVVAGVPDKAITGYNFPVGNNPYTPVVVNLIGTGTLTVSTTAGDHPDYFNPISSPNVGLNLGRSVNRYWSMSFDGALTSYDATFVWDELDVDALFDWQQPRVEKYDGSDWTPIPDAETIPGTVTSTTIVNQTSFSDFAIANTCLPADWTFPIAVDQNIETVNDPGECFAELWYDDLVALVSPYLIGIPTPTLTFELTPPPLSNPHEFAVSDTRYSITATAASECALPNSSRVFKLLVEDKEPPYLVGTLPGDTDLQCISEVEDGDYYIGDVEAAYDDYCSTPVTASLVDTETEGDNCAGWTITYTYEVSDDAGNVVTDVKVIFAGQDTEAPVSTLTAALDDTFEECIAWAYAFNESILYNDVLGYVTDNCTASPTVTASNAVVSGDDCGWIIDMWFRVEDACGNAVTPTVQYTGENATPPGLVSPTVTCASLNEDEIDACIDAAEDFADGVGPLSGYTNVSELVTEVEALYVGECTDPVTATFTYDLIGDDCEWTLIFHFTITDACGLSSTCTVVFEGYDQTDPVFTSFPADINENSGTSCQYFATWTPPTATDNCGGVPTIVGAYTSYIPGPGVTASPGATGLNFVTGQGLFEIGVHEITYTATDACGNKETQVLTITILDRYPPQFDTPCPDDIVVDNDPGVCGAVLVPGTDFTPPAFIEQCSMPVTRWNTKPVDNFYPVGVTTVTYYAEDAAGNQNSCTFTVTVVDAEAPQLVDVNEDCSTLDLDEQNICLAAAEAFDPATLIDDVLDLYWDNCGTVSVTTIDTWAGTSNTDCEWIFQYTFTISDLADVPNTVTCVVTYTGGDTEDPELIPSPVVLDASDIDDCMDYAYGVDTDAVAAAVAANYTDNCGTVSATLVGTVEVTGTDCDWTAVWTFRVFDDCENAVTETVTHTGGDSSAPTPIPGMACSDLNDSGIDMCKAEAEAYALPGSPEAELLEAAVAALYEDACTVSPTVTMIDQTTTGDDCAWTIVFTFDISDDCENSTSCTVTYTGSNEQLPIFYITVSGSDPEMIVDGDGKIDTAVKCAGEVPDDDTNDLFGDGTTVLSATSYCGEIAGIVLVGEYKNPSAPLCPNDYVLRRLWKATDDCGKEAFYNQYITVFDDVKPTFDDLPGNVTVTCTANVPDPELVTATDNCAGTVTVTYSEETVSVECESRYVINRTYTATDACGNVATHTQTITVYDDIAPTVSTSLQEYVEVDCPDDVEDPDLDAFVGSYDNCGGDVYVAVMSDVFTYSEVCDARFTITRDYVLWDDCGNTVTWTQTIAVTNDIEPSITSTLQAVVDVTCYGNIPDPELDKDEVTGVANCGGVVTPTWDDQILSETCDDRLVIERTWTVTDECGNFNTWVQTINVYDDIAPTITPTVAQSLNFKCASEVPILSVDVVEIEAADNCGGTVIKAVHETRVDGDCVNDFVLTRTYTATDDCGNVATWVQTITVLDDIAPTVTCTVAGNADRDTDEGECTYTVVGDEFDAIASDNCGTVEITYEVVDQFAKPVLTTLAGVELPSGVNTIIATAVDACGNKASCTFTVTVKPSHIEGFVMYPNQPQYGGMLPMSGTVRFLNAAKTPIGGASTAINPATGYYSLDIPATAEYLEIVSGKPYIVFAALNSTDAQAVQAAATDVAFAPVFWSPFHDVVGDVDDNGLVPLDALYIMNRLRGISNVFATDWTFMSTTDDVIFDISPNNPLTAGYRPYNFDVCSLDHIVRARGDVTGKYRINLTKSATPMQTDQVMRVSAGESFVMPVTMEQSVEFGSMTLFIDYNADKLEVLDVVSAIPDIHYQLVDGTIVVSWMDMYPVSISAGDAVVELVLKTRGVVHQDELLFSLDSKTAFGDRMANIIEHVGLSVKSVTNVDAPVGIADPDRALGSLAAYPNPFREELTLSYTLAEAGNVQISIVNMLGAEVARVVDSHHAAGSFEQVYRPESRMEYGVYFIRYSVQGVNNTTSQVVRLVYMR